MVVEGDLQVWYIKRLSTNNKNLKRFFISERSDPTLDSILEVQLYCSLTIFIVTRAFALFKRQGEMNALPNLLNLVILRKVSKYIESRCCICSKSNELFLLSMKTRSGLTGRA